MTTTDSRNDRILANAYTRSTRYVIRATFKDGRTDDCLEANSRRVDAIKRAAVISQTWPSVTRVWVQDSAPGIWRDRTVFAIDTDRVAFEHIG